MLRSLRAVLPQISDGRIKYLELLTPMNYYAELKSYSPFGMEMNCQRIFDPETFYKFTTKIAGFYVSGKDTGCFDIGN